MDSIIVSVQSNKARALHIKQKFGRRLHQTTRRKAAEVSLLSFQFVSSGERPLLAGKDNGRFYTKGHIIRLEG